jgi:hypothetical protein
MRLWTSAKMLKGCDKEFCFMVNDALRTDRLAGMGPLSTYVRGLNQLCVDRRHDPVPVKWPANSQLFRGGGFPDHLHGWFTAGKCFRVPMYLASSSNRDVSLKTFCKRAYDQGVPAVLWTIHLDTNLRCVHVNYVDRSNVEGEDEFLFVPYSVFTVRSVDWKANPHLGQATRDPPGRGRGQPVS